MESPISIKRSREESVAAPPAAAPSSGRSSSSSSSAAAPAPFRGPAADSVLGERLIDVIGIVAAMGFAAEVAHCLYLCGETWRKGDKGATNDMLVRSIERQCGASAARAAKREAFQHSRWGIIYGTTQLMRAVMLNNLPRVLQLVQLGTSLALWDMCQRDKRSALLWSCDLGSEHLVRILLDGKYEGQGALVDACNDNVGLTPLMAA